MFAVQKTVSSIYMSSNLNTDKLSETEREDDGKILK